MAEIASKMFSLKLPDWVKAFVMFVLGAVVNTIYQAIMEGGIASVEWNEVGATAITAALTYLVKNFFSDEKGRLGGVIG